MFVLSLRKIWRATLGADVCCDGVSRNRNGVSILCLHQATCAHASGATQDSCFPVSRVNSLRCMCSFFRVLAVNVVRRKIPDGA